MCVIAGTDGLGISVTDRTASGVSLHFALNSLCVSTAYAGQLAHKFCGSLYLHQDYDGHAVPGFSVSSGDSNSNLSSHV